MALINCKECKKEISDSVKKCPNCGVKIRSKKQKIINYITYLFIALIFFNLETCQKFLSENSAPNSQYNDLQLLEHKWCSLDFGVNGICGTIINNSNSTKSYAQVGINLYDKSGNQVGSTLSNINGLEPGSKWKFKAVVIEDTVNSYKIMDITSY